MRTRSILILIDPMDDAASAEDAFDLAEIHDLHMRIVVVGVAPGSVVTSYRGQSLQEWAARRDDIMRKLERKAEEMEETLQRRGISGDVARHLVEERDLAGLAAIHARYVDLPMLTGGRTPWHRNLTTGLIFQSGRPLLVVPPNRKPPLAPKRVVVAWNGRLEAVRALHASLDLLSTADQVAVVMIDPSFSEWGSGQEPGFDIAGMIARHRIPTEVYRLEAKGREPGILLLDKAAEISADLVVMGAYGHSRMWEWVLGGTSRHMLMQADIPVFMMH